MIDLCTVSGVAAILKGTLDSASEDLIGRFIASVSAAAETRWLRRKTKLETHTRQMDIDRGQRVIFLDAYPVSAAPVPEFRNDLSREFTGDAIDASSYYLDLTSGIVEFDRVYLIQGAGVLEAMWTGGMASSTAALISGAAFDDVIRGAEIQVAHMFQRRLDIGRSSLSAEGGSLQLARPALTLCDATRELWYPHMRTQRTR